MRFVAAPAISIAAATITIAATAIAIAATSIAIAVAVAAVTGTAINTAAFAIATAVAAAGGPSDIGSHAAIDPTYANVRTTSSHHTRPHAAARTAASCIIKLAACPGAAEHRATALATGALHVAATAAAIERVREPKWRRRDAPNDPLDWR